MPITHKKVEKLFNYLKTGQNELFFQQVAPDVQWSVMGHHPLAGTYHNKEDFISHTFQRLNKILKEGVVLEFKNIFIDGEVAIVEMESLSMALNGKPFNNTYCWITRFENDVIVEVRAYVDSALVQKVIDENENI
jgi:uncharacterized protein